MKYLRTTAAILILAAASQTFAIAPKTAYVRETLNRPVTNPLWENWMNDKYVQWKVKVTEIVNGQAVDSYFYNYAKLGTATCVIAIQAPQAPQPPGVYIVTVTLPRQHLGSGIYIESENYTALVVYDPSTTFLYPPGYLNPINLTN